MRMGARKSSNRFEDEFHKDGLSEGRLRARYAVRLRARGSEEARNRRTTRPRSRQVTGNSLSSNNARKRPPWFFPLGKKVEKRITKSLPKQSRGRFRRKLFKTIQWYLLQTNKKRTRRRKRKRKKKKAEAKAKAKARKKTAGSKRR